MTTVVQPSHRTGAIAATAYCCPLCGSDDYKLFVGAKQRTVVECRGCHLRALSPMPTLADLVTINEETVHPFFNACVEDEETYRVYFASKLDDLQRYQPSGSLLDVGCGTGFFLEAARQRGYDIAGVDLSPVPAEYVQRRLGLNVSIGSLYKYAGPSMSFDAVTIFQTIEHDPHPADLCKELLRILKPGGALMVTTPAADGFVARVMGKRWFGYRNVEHVSFFSRESLRYALVEAGFEIEFVEIEHGKRLTGKYILNRLINYYYDHRTFLRNGLRLLHPVIWASAAVPLFEPWAHLYAVARRPVNSNGVPAYLSSADTSAR